MDKEDLTTKLVDENKQETKTEVDNDTVSEKSKIVILVFDLIENFEYKHTRIAGCLYAIGFSFLTAFFILMKQRHFIQLPYLEFLFIPIMIQFCINFKLITKSNILPYIAQYSLNWQVKHAALFSIASIVLLVASLQDQDAHLSVMIFLSVWPLYYIYENKKIQLPQFGLPFIGIFIGTIFSSGAFYSQRVDILSIGMALAGGFSLCYAGHSFKILEKENIFTIIHVIGLLNVIFLPLFFPIEGITQPGLGEWFFFTITGLFLFLAFPVLIRAFAVENTSIVLSQLVWVIPIYQLLNLVINGTFPHFLDIIGSAVVIYSSVIIISDQDAVKQKKPIFLQREQQIQPLPLQVEMKDLGEQQI